MTIPAAVISESSDYSQIAVFTCANAVQIIAVTIPDAVIGESSDYSQIAVFTCTNATCTIQSIYLSQNYEILKPSFVKVTQYIHRTLHTRYGICFLEFFRSSNDLEPFHAEYYSRANTIVCNHTGSESNKNECVFCKELYHA